MRIETQRLIIRGYKAEDVTAAHSFLSLEEVMYFLPEDVFNMKEVEHFINKQLNEPRYFAVEEKSTKQVIGHILFEPWFGKHTYEIGWVFHPSVYKRGYATESAYAVIKYGFEDLNLHRVIATCQPENTASYKIMEKLKMRREGHFVECVPQNGEWWDEYFYSVLQREWNK